MANDTSRNTHVSTPAPAPVASPSTTESQLSAALIQLAEANQRMVALMEQQSQYNAKALDIAPRRKKTMEEYLGERRKRGAGKRLRHEVFQNGRPVNPSGLSDETIKRLDTLASGTYADGLVDVIRRRDGLNGVNTRIHIMYNNRDQGQRMQIYMRFPTFTSMVNAIADEMARLANGDPKSPYAPQLDESALPVEPEFPESQ